jgi:3-keto-L-gulonate-6-phosphate decarboxylase
MVAKVHESYDAGQFLTGSLVHFDIANAGGIDAKHVVETAGTRATVVILGAGAARIAVENNGAWDAAGLEAALGAGYTVTDFAY